MSEIPGYLTVAEVAKILNVDPSQVRRYCMGDGTVKLPAKKIGNQWFVREVDLKKFTPAPRGNPNLQKIK